MHTRDSDGVDAIKKEKKTEESNWLHIQKQDGGFRAHQRRKISPLFLQTVASSAVFVNKTAIKVLSIKIRSYPFFLFQMGQITAHF